jgi:hypothetical protein
MKLGQIITSASLRPGLPAGWALPWNFQQFLLKPSDQVAVDLATGTAVVTIALESA